MARWLDAVGEHPEATMVPRADRLSGLRGVYQHSTDAETQRFLQRLVN